MGKRSKDKQERVEIRMSEEQKEKLKQEAKKEGNSMNQKITEYIDSL